MYFRQVRTARQQGQKGYQLITDNLLSDLARLVETLTTFAIILTAVNLASHRSAYRRELSQENL
jgi:hypothetical protein